MSSKAKEAELASDVSSILKRILGDSCQETIDIFNDQEIDTEAFYSLDKEVLVELGMHALHFLLLFSSILFYRVYQKKPNPRKSGSTKNIGNRRMG